MSLLSKTRELNTLLQKHKGIAVDFKDVAQTISSVTVTNVFIVSRKGKILGSNLNELLKNERIIQMLENRHIPVEYTDQLGCVIYVLQQLRCALYEGQQRTMLEA